MDKRTRTQAVVATGILLWAGGLQYYMYKLTASDEFKKSEITQTGKNVNWSISNLDVRRLWGGGGGGNDGPPRVRRNPLLPKPGGDSDGKDGGGDTTH
jgi:hypothetical protein